MKDIVIWGLCIVCLLGGIVGGIYIHQHEDIYYEGKEVFTSQEDYSDFRVEIVREEVEIVNLVVLSWGEPPVVVAFEVRVPNDYPFPYGGRGPGACHWLIAILATLPLLVRIGFKMDTRLVEK